jgi:hypothetical protein
MGGRRGCDRMVVGFTTELPKQTVPITTDVVLKQILPCIILYVLMINSQLRYIIY